MRTDSLTPAQKVMFVFVICAVAVAGIGYAPDAVAQTASVSLVAGEAVDIFCAGDELDVVLVDDGHYLATCLEAPTPTATVTATPQPAQGENLLVNGNFSDGFTGWSQTNGFWRIHDITGSQCDADNPDWPDYMAEMDRDRCKACNTWPVGGEDRLWQDVLAPPHSVVTLMVTEAHHMNNGVAELTVYGSNDGESWEVVFFRAAPDAEWGAGHHCETPPTFDYTFTSSFTYYRLELHGTARAVAEDGDGWIAGPLSLTTE